ncbi:damage-inducible protein DinB [Mesorhizobium sp. CGMCC 1.15528]|uniref:Damage-inducible protein DinB n=1 Tax=Mesorhizobium zhangyense TaxID=1776730 RepID=A0A7C9R9R0_9HYPH|nr:DinB family protein [Mesorhizobium zhangyense]NGN43721.1 damage-inducible protein DinB [Mesorhizobium zhangyense]
MSALLQKLYTYHAWANNDLFDKLGALDQEEYKTQLHTALRLINHYYVVARIFTAHLTGEQHGFTSDNTDETPTLADLRAAVTSSDQWYLDYLRRVSTENLAEAMPFIFTDGDKGYMTREEMLTHVALHGAYHRGEVGRILWQLSITPPWDTFAVYLHRTDPTRRQQGGKQLILA